VLDKDQNVSEDCLPSKKPPYIDSPPLPLPKQRKAHSFISTQTIEYNQPSPISESVMSMASRTLREITPLDHEVLYNSMES